VNWKHTELAKLKTASTSDGLRRTRHPKRYGKAAALAGWVRGFGAHEQAISALAAAREAAWNSGDVAACRELLTEGADIVSATGGDGHPQHSRAGGDQTQVIQEGEETMTDPWQVTQLQIDQRIYDHHDECGHGGLDWREFPRRSAPVVAGGPALAQAPLPCYAQAQTACFSDPLA